MLDVVCLGRKKEPRLAEDEREALQSQIRVSRLYESVEKDADSFVGKLRIHQGVRWHN